MGWPFKVDHLFHKNWWSSLKVGSPREPAVTFITWDPQEREYVSLQLCHRITETYRYNCIWLNIAIILYYPPIFCSNCWLLQYFLSTLTSSPFIHKAHLSVVFSLEFSHCLLNHGVLLIFNKTMTPIGKTYQTPGVFNGEMYVLPEV